MNRPRSFRHIPRTCSQTRTGARRSGKRSRGMSRRCYVRFPPSFPLSFGQSFVQRSNSTATSPTCPRTVPTTAWRRRASPSTPIFRRGPKIAPCLVSWPSTTADEPSFRPAGRRSSGRFPCCARLRAASSRWHGVRRRLSESTFLLLTSLSCRRNSRPTFWTCAMGRH